MTDTIMKQIEASMDGFTAEQLNAAFKKVQDVEHWKNPIDATVDESDRRVLDAAIPFYTGSIAEWHDLGNGKLRVTADGYFATVGA